MSIAQREANRRYYEKNKNELNEKRLLKYYQEKLPEKIEKWNRFLDDVEKSLKTGNLTDKFSNLAETNRQLEKLKKIIEKLEEIPQEIRDTQERFETLILRNAL